MSSASRAKVPFAATIEVRDACYCLHLQRAARAMARRFDDALRPHGLTNGQFSLMMALNAPEPTTIPRVAALLGMDRTTVTANLKPLEKRGLVESEVDPGDRRARRPRLTGKGHALLLSALPTWTKTQAEVETVVPASHARRLRDDLAALGGWTAEPAANGNGAAAALPPPVNGLDRSAARPPARRREPALDRR